MNSLSLIVPLALQRLLFHLSLASLLHGAAASGAEPSTSANRDSPLQVRLVSEVAAIQPGKAFEVGLQLRHGPGYHSYWSFPGIVGVPTRIEWNLPEGFQAGPLQWEIPERVDMRGIGAYGYTRDVLLTSRITPPPQLPADARLRGRVSWMACSQESCNPGFLDVELLLPTASPDADPSSLHDPYWHPRFETRRLQEPRPIEGWTAEAWRSETGFELLLRPTTEPARAQFASLRSVHFFNSNALVASNKAHRYDIDADRGEIRCLLPFHDFAGPNAERLSGVFVADPPWNEPPSSPPGVLIEAPIHSSTAK